MTTKPCSSCGVDLMSGDMCWLCEVELEGKPIFVDLDSSGRIIFWSNVAGDFGMELTAEEFGIAVREQYPRS